MTSAVMALVSPPHRKTLMKIDITAATASQLAEFASVHHGIDIDHRRGRDAILAALATVGFTGTEIEVSEPKTAVAPNPAVTPQTARKYRRIMIPNQNEPGGKDPVPVGVNGVVALIKRGVPVDVPAEYVHVLENAKKVVYEKDENGRPVRPQEVPTHTFSELPMV
jgi:hypothetical protein